jgi:hypothetical protein
VAVEPTFQSVGVLAVIVLVRTFLSFTLEVELEGRWRRAPRRVGFASERRHCVDRIIALPQDGAVGPSYPHGNTGFRAVAWVLVLPTLVILAVLLAG